MKRYQAYLVEWVDAISRSGWKIPGDDLSLVPNSSLGYIVERTRDHIGLAQTIGHDQDAMPFSTVTSIPRGCIMKMTKIAER